MPLVIHPRVRKSVARIAVLTCTAVFASTGAAFAASCPTQSTSTPFASYGDDSSYFLIPGGAFEGSSAWTLDNATLSTTAAPSAAGSSEDETGAGAGKATVSSVLTVTGGGSATSPWFCLDETMPDFRFFARQVSHGSPLRVVGLVKTWYGVATIRVAQFADGSMPAWTLVGKIKVSSKLIPRGLSLPVAVRFEVPGAAGSWQLDDVYVDPYRNS